jgi:hypothetical protein
MYSRIAAAVNRKKFARSGDLPRRFAASPADFPRDLSNSRAALSACVIPSRSRRFLDPTPAHLPVAVTAQPAAAARPSLQIRVQN